MTDQTSPPSSQVAERDGYLPGSRLWPLCPDPQDCAGHTPACRHNEGAGVLACSDCIAERQVRQWQVFCLSDDAEVHQFIWETWTDEQRSEHMERLGDAQRRHYERTGKPMPLTCTCVDWCGEGSEAGCPDCVQRDIYNPCPAVGFGCGWLGGRAARCDCCSDSEWAAAVSNDARVRATAQPSGSAPGGQS